MARAVFVLRDDGWMQMASTISRNGMYVTSNRNLSLSLSLSLNLSQSLISRDCVYVYIYVCVCVCLIFNMEKLTMIITIWFNDLSLSLCDVSVMSLCVNTNE